MEQSYVGGSHGGAYHNSSDDQNYDGSRFNDGQILKKREDWIDDRDITRASMESSPSLPPERVKRTRFLAMAQLARAQLGKSSSATPVADHANSEIDTENGTTSDAVESSTSGALNALAAVTISKATENLPNEGLSLIRVLHSQGQLSFVEATQLKKINKMILGLQQERAQGQSIDKQNIWREVIGADGELDGALMTEEVEKKTNELLSEILARKQRGREMKEKPAISKSHNREKANREIDKGNLDRGFKDTPTVDSRIRVGIERLKIENEKAIKLDGPRDNTNGTSHLGAKSGGVLKGNGHRSTGGCTEAGCRDKKIRPDVGSNKSQKGKPHSNLKMNLKGGQTHNNLRDEINLCKERVDPLVMEERIKIGLNVLREV